VNCIWKEGKGDPVLVVGEGPVPAGRPVLILKPFSEKRDNAAPHFLAFNRSDDANRVQDILTALAFLHGKYPGKIELMGTGNAAVQALFAAAVAPIEVKLSAGTEGFRGSDEEFVKSFFVPGIQRAGGLEAARMLTSR
jgi:hypothetical protein